MFVKKFKIPVLAYALFFAGAYGFHGAASLANSQVPDERNESYKVKAQESIAVFQKALKTELMAAMSEGGPQAAVSICNEKAPQIAAQLGEDAGVELRRTALKVRNPDNQPTDWQREVLKSFEGRKADGEGFETLEAELMRDDVYIYMKVIPTKGICLTCHGSEIPTPLDEHIKNLYPDDQAIGFEDGDLRGAFVVSIRKDL